MEEGRLKVTIHESPREFRTGQAYAAHASLNHAVCARDYSFKLCRDPEFAAQQRAIMRESALEAVAFAKASGLSLPIVFGAWRATYALRCACQAA